MSIVYALTPESGNQDAVYTAGSKVVGAGNSIAYSSTPKLGGVPKDLLLSVANNNATYFEGVYSAIATNYCFCRYIVDTSSLTTLTTGQFFYFSYLIGSSGNSNSTVGLLYSGGVPKVYHVVRDDSLVTHGAVVALPLSPFLVEVRLYKSSSGVAADGRQELWINGALSSTTGSKILYDIFSYEKIRIGSNANNGVTGSLAIGKLLITNDANPIGPFLSYRHRPRPAAIMKKRQRIKGHRCG